jgi:hypothetical protein
MVVAGTSAGELPSGWKRPQLGATDRDGRIGNDAAFSMRDASARSIAGSAPVNGTVSARLEQARQSSASGASLSEVPQSALLLEHGRTSLS